MVMHAELTLRNDRETQMTRCAICATEFEPLGRQRFCTPACRQKAWRRRHPTPLPSIPARAPRLISGQFFPERDVKSLYRNGGWVSTMGSD